MASKVLGATEELKAVNLEANELGVAILSATGVGIVEIIRLLIFFGLRSVNQLVHLCFK